MFLNNLDAGVLILFLMKNFFIKCLFVNIFECFLFNDTKLNLLARYETIGTAVSEQIEATPCIFSFSTIWFNFFLSFILIL